MRSALSLEGIRQAQAIVAKAARVTPLLSSRTFSEVAGAQVYLKAENLQRTGSFKVRGATNRIARLTLEERKRGVVAASAGNHSQGVALASQALGVRSTVVMPEGASIAKVKATRGYGAEVILHGADYEEAQSEAYRRATADGLAYVHGFDDPHVIAGQGTIGLEILEQMPDVQDVLVPVGGGGLIAGVALALKLSNPKVRVFGVQTESAPAGAVAFQKGRRVLVHPKPSIADGIAIGRLGEHPFAVIRKHVDNIVTVSEEEVAHAVVLLLERGKMLVEGAGAVGLAALLSGRFRSKGRSIAVVLSGGNVDLPLLARILEHGLAEAGRSISIRVAMRDRPGELAHLLDILAKCEANVSEVLHHRRGIHEPVGVVEIEVTAETRDAAHIDYIAQLLATNGYVPEEPPQRPGERPGLYFVSREI